MKLHKDFVMREIAREHIMVGVNTRRFSGMVRSNKTAAEIVNLLKEETTEEEIVKAMMEKYDGEETEIREDVALVIGKLRSIGALIP